MVYTLNITWSIHPTISYQRQCLLGQHLNTFVLVLEFSFQPPSHFFRYFPHYLFLRAYYPTLFTSLTGLSFSPISLHTLSRLHPHSCESAPSALHFTSLCSSLSRQLCYINIMQVYQRQKKMLLSFYFSCFVHILLCSLMWHGASCLWSAFMTKQLMVLVASVPACRTHTPTTFRLVKNRSKCLTDTGSQSQMFGKEALSYDRHGLGM